MLTIQKCRKLLGPEYKLTDQQILKLLDQLNELAEMLLSAYENENKPTRPEEKTDKSPRRLH